MTPVFIPNLKGPDQEKGEQQFVPPSGHIGIKSVVNNMTQSSPIELSYPSLTAALCLWEKRHINAIIL